MTEWLREIKIDTVFKMLLTAFIWASSTYISKLETKIDLLETKADAARELAAKVAADESAHNTLQEWRLLQLERGVLPPSKKP